MELSLLINWNRTLACVLTPESCREPMLCIVFATGCTLLFTSSGTACCNWSIWPCRPLLLCALETPLTLVRASAMALDNSS